MAWPADFDNASWDSLIEHHAWGQIVWLSGAHVFADSDQTLGYVVIDPGQTNYRHRHPNCEEILVLVEGRLEHLVGDEIILMEPGQALRIPPGTVHRALNPGMSAARMIVAYPVGSREIELVPESDPPKAGGHA